MSNNDSKAIVLKIAYDDSDIMTDYFNRDRPFETYYLADLQGKVVTEAKLRACLKLLPEWIRNHEWGYQKGEKYSMSDHYYGQLRVDKGIGATIHSSSHYDVGMCLIITVEYLSTFEMNNRKDHRPPESLEELKARIKAKQEAAEKRRQELKPKILEASIKMIENVSHVMDETGFHAMSPQEKEEKIQRLLTEFTKDMTPEAKQVLQEAEAVARYLKKTPPYVS